MKMTPLYYTPIAPTCALEALADQHLFQFCLLHELANDVEYQVAYMKMSRRGANHIIMDNGAFELGVVPDIKDLCYWIDAINPTEFILPDRMFFGDETLTRSLEAVEELRVRYPGMGLMAVPHGRNIREWMECMHVLIESGATSIGVPKDYEAWSGGRFALLSHIMGVEAANGNEPKPVHFLGMERRYTEALASMPQAFRKRIRSIDSVKPVVEAIIGTENPYAGRPQNYFRMELTDEQIRKILQHTNSVQQQLFNLAGTDLLLQG